MVAEVPLQLAYGSRLMNGTADLLMFSEEAIVLIDHKVLDTDPEVLGEHAEQYATQLSWYHRALRAQFPQAAIVSSLNFPLQGRVVRVALRGR